MAIKRVVFYLFYDSQGVVDDYVTHMLAALRPHAEHVFVVSNSALTPDSRSRLDAVADTVWVRENVGFDVWGYKEAMEAFGWDRLAEYDEALFMNYTVFGPVFPFSELFDRMDAADVDFWGVTAHKEVDPNPFGAGPDVLPMHIQSHWIAVRHRMLVSREFRSYWDTMPMITSYDDSILKHESRFTGHFAAKGFRFDVAYPPENYPDDHPIFEDFSLLLDDRCPIVKRRIFFHEPTYLDRRAIIGRRLVERLEAETDYPVDLIWRNVVRTVEPRTLHTNLSLLEVLPEEDDGWRPPPERRIAVFAHMYYADMADEIMACLANIPVEYDLYVSTSSEPNRAELEQTLGGAAGVGKLEVRVVEQNRGRDMSSLFITFRDVLRSGDYDYALRVHSKKSPQNDYNNGQLFKRHMFDNLLLSPGYVAKVLRLFEENDTLGMMFPPVVHIGFPTLGHAWFNNREPAEEWAEKLGITTTFDRSTPIAAYGTMFWFRPEALRDLTDYEFAWSDYPAEPGHKDGGLAHVQERLLAYAAMNAGFHVRAILNRDWAGISHTFLEYKLQRISALLPAYTQDQVDELTRLQSTTFLGDLKRLVSDHLPRLSRAARPVYLVARSAYRGRRRLTGRLTRDR
ncbi:rhamnan synthesis F family protein [Cellulomonas avistercoris]|uniref:rhamnan synthesis F family protein n=1 Tax=Cellulomonas avistercoris TaxID=2762242 RepID=UPI00296A91AB|nr:rhamnan synthesis F family protein [Cellulomonas avistercoris]